MTIKKEINHWLENFIIGQNICPFAKEPFEKEQIHIIENTSDDPEVLFNFTLQEIINLSDSNAHTTSLVVMPNFPKDFFFFNDFTYELQEALEKSSDEPFFQVVAFHPLFCFHAKKPQDRANIVNRSPYPLIHILRSKDVESALTDPKQGEAISYRNEELLKNMPKEQLYKLCPHLKK